jgi:hypothetical protein
VGSRTEGEFVTQVRSISRLIVGSRTEGEFVTQVLSISRMQWN